MFLRGVTGSRSGTYADPEATSRLASAAGGNADNAVGSVQTNAFKLHRHQVPRDGTGISGNDNQSLTATGSDDEAYMDEPGTGPTGGAETRPNNAYANEIIKY